MNWKLAARAEKMNPSVIREILKVTEQPGIISLAGGLPSPDSFPIDALPGGTSRVVRDTRREALHSASSEGFTPMTIVTPGDRTAAGSTMMKSQVLITTGSQLG